MYKMILKLMVLSLIMSISLYACSGNDNKNPYNADDSANDSKPSIDLEGEEFVFAANDVLMPNFWVDEPKTFEDDAMVHKFKQTEENLNCVIKIQTEKMGFESQILADALSTGLTGRDIIYSSPALLYGLIKADLVVPLDELSAIDLSDEQKWSSGSRREACVIKGKTYAVPGTGSLYWPSMPIYNGCFIANNDLIKAFNVPYPSEIIEKGEWTFNNFKNILPLYGDNNEENRIYSLELYDSPDIIDVFTMSALTANGASLVIKQDDGRFTFGLSDKKAINALEWVKDIVAMKDNVIKAKKEKKIFAGGKASFIVTSSWRGLATFNDFEIMNNLNDVSWYHFPYGPDVEYGKNYSSYITNGFGATAILINDRDEKAGIVMNELFSPLEEYGKEGYLGFLKQNYFHNTESFDVYYDELVNARYDYSNQLSSIQPKIGSALEKIIKGTATINEAIGSIEQSVNDVIDVEMNS